MDTQKVFIKNFKRLVETSGMEQQKVAERAGVSESTVSAWLHGDRYPRPEVMGRLATAMHCDVSDLLREDKTGEHAVVLTEEERRLVKMFGAVPEGRRVLVMDMIASLLKHSDN